MKIDDYLTVSEWWVDAKREGYSVPLPMCHGLVRIMEELHLSFPETFKLLVQERKILLKGKTFLYDLSAHNAWLEERKDKQAVEAEIEKPLFEPKERTGRTFIRFEGKVYSFAWTRNFTEFEVLEGSSWRKVQVREVDFMEVLNMGEVIPASEIPEESLRSLPEIPPSEDAPDKAIG